MTTFRTISNADIKTSTSTLNQLIDFVEQDISGSSSRKKYQVFVTSSGGHAITSSLYQTVYDQNFALQTSNELFDLTFGLYYNGTTVTGGESNNSPDALGKRLFPTEHPMMREKINIYRQYAQLLLGNANSRFTSPFSNHTANADEIDEALFINFKRLFVRDGIKRETFAIKLLQSSSAGHATDDNKQNINVTALNPGSGSAIFTDVGASSNLENSPTGGPVGNIVNASDTSQRVGLLFYNQGIAVFDMKKVFHANQIITGSIQTVGSTATNPHFSASFIPAFLRSGSMDDVMKHIATTRFGSGSNTFLTFQNNTKLNSTLVYCRAPADEFNFSSNPTYTDTDGKINVVTTGNETNEKAFSFITTIGLYDANEELLAVAKLSRPVEKNDEKDLTFRVRLDF